MACLPQFVVVVSMYSTSKSISATSVSLQSMSMSCVTYVEPTFVMKGKGRGYKKAACCFGCANLLCGQASAIISLVVKLFLLFQVLICNCSSGIDGQPRCFLDCYIQDLVTSWVLITSLSTSFMTEREKLRVVPSSATTTDFAAALGSSRAGQLGLLVRRCCTFAIVCGKADNLKSACRVLLLFAA